MPPHPDERDARGFKRIWIDYTVQAAAPPSEVFQVLGDLDHWASWSPGVVSVKRSGGPLAVGSRFLLSIKAKPLPIALALPCQLFVLSPDRIEWGGGLPGSKIRHRFELTPSPSGGTYVRHVEYATNLLALLALPAERFAYGHDRRWSEAIRERFAAG